MNRVRGGGHVSHGHVLALSFRHGQASIKVDIIKTRQTVAEMKDE